MSKEYYTQNGEKIKVDEYGNVYGSNSKLGHVDEYGKFYSSQSDTTATVDDYGNIIDGNGKIVGKVDGINKNQITSTGSTSSSSSESSNVRISFFDKILSWLLAQIFSWKFIIIAWIIGMIICIASGDAPWD